MIPIEPSVSNICILQNPISKNKKGERIAKQILETLKHLNIPFILFKKEWPPLLKDYSDIWIIGGDGTLNYFLNKYRHIPAPLVLFKAGTGNDFYWKLYGNNSTAQQIQLALHTPYKFVDIACCNDILYANSAGFGFDGEVLKSINAIRFIGGHAGYLGVVIKKIFHFKEFHFTIKKGERTIDQKCLLLTVNNSSRTGGGFLVTPKARIDDGWLDVVICNALSVWKRLRYLPVIEKGKHLELPFISYTHDKEIHIKTKEQIFAQIDGELICGNEFNIRILPGFVKFRF